MNFKIDKKNYSDYLAKSDTIDNERIRSDDQNFFDALLTIDMKNDRNGKQAVKIINAL